MNTQTDATRDERALNIDNIVSEQLRREAEFDRIRLDRELNGPTPIELAQQRIAELEAQRDETEREISGWVQDLQAYFPGATTMHDIYRSIEAMEAKIAVFKARDVWMNARIDYAEYRDAAGVPCFSQPADDGYWNKSIHGDLFTFTDFIDQTIKIGK